MTTDAALYAPVEEARKAAIDVLLHNAHGPHSRLPRTAGWGYPEPYTRDMMICGLGFLTSGEERLAAVMRRVLEALARNQTLRGHIPSLANDPLDRGASDTTPLFLLGLAIYRRAVGEPNFLEEAAEKALTWMEYQSPDDCILVAQQPTSDWRDEQWVLGYGLFVNTIVHAYLRLYGRNDDADMMRRLMNRFTVTAQARSRHIHEGLALPDKPYYALWAYKVLGSERFDLLGNSLAILAGVASHKRSLDITHWIEAECDALRANGLLASELPPCLFPYIKPEDPDWRRRYARFGPPGDYHNGGIWPFISGFYVAALVAAGRQRLAQEKLEALARLNRPALDHDVPFGFNEWFRAQDATPQGQDWQSWSAAMYLYALACVERRSTPFFDEVRQHREGAAMEKEAAVTGEADVRQ